MSSFFWRIRCCGSPDSYKNGDNKKPALSYESGLIEFCLDFYGDRANLNFVEVFAELLGFTFRLSLPVNAVKDYPFCRVECEVPLENFVFVV